MSERIVVPTDAGEMPARLWRPGSGAPSAADAAPGADRRPGVVLLQEIFGISRYVLARAQDVADLGYVVLVPETYWRLGAGAAPEGPDALEVAMDLVGRLDWDAAVADAAAAVRYLRGYEATDGHVGLLGFCFGSGLAFNVAAVEPVDVLVSYHGSALPGLLDMAPRVRCPSLHHFGLNDAYIPAETVAAIRAATEPQGAEFHTYDGAGHAFDNPDYEAYDPQASAQAWERTVEFLRRRLG